MMRASPEPDVVTWAAAQLGWPPNQTVCERLTGGTSWETYRLSWSRQAVVLRVAPESGTMKPYAAGREAASIAAAGKSVPTPAVLAVDADGSASGRSCVLLQHMGGVLIRSRDEVPAALQSRYRRAFGKALGAIHSEGNPSALDSTATITDALVHAIERSVATYQKTAYRRHPGFEIGLRWLLTYLPRANARPVLCHGDYRLRNLLWKGPGVISAVLDWERAWAGDPMADVAFTRLSSRWCSIRDEGELAYEVATGVALIPERIEYGMTFERWRSYTSSMRAMRAHAEGRSDDPRMERIGLAGDAGAWRLVDLLGDGPLQPLPAVALKAASRHGWTGAATEHASVAAVEALEAHAENVPGLAAALTIADPTRAYREAHDLLAAAAATGGPELVGALRALSVHATVTLHMREQSQWR